MSKRRPDKTIQAEVKKEMAEPRRARSARIAELKADPSRIAESPSVTVPGTVEKILPVTAHQPEKAQVAIAGAAKAHRDFQIENVMTDEHGDDVKLKKGSSVEVTVSQPHKS
jgi:hypothetical protein